MSKKYELRELKEQIFKREIKKLVDAKTAALGDDATMKDVAIELAKDLGLKDYMGLYRTMYKL